MLEDRSQVMEDRSQVLEDRSQVLEGLKCWKVSEKMVGVPMLR